MSRKTLYLLVIVFVLLAFIAGAALTAAVLDDGLIGLYSWKVREAEDDRGEHLRVILSPSAENVKWGIAPPELYQLEDGRYVVKIRQEQPRCLACPTVTPTP